MLKRITYLKPFFLLFLKGSPPLFLRVVQTYKKESIFVYADNTAGMNDDHDMNMKLFRIISPCNWATENKE